MTALGCGEGGELGTSASGLWALEGGGGKQATQSPALFPAGRRPGCSRDWLHRGLGFRMEDPCAGLCVICVLRVCPPCALRLMRCCGTSAPAWASGVGFWIPGSCAAMPSSGCPSWGIGVGSLFAGHRELHRGLCPPPTSAVRRVAKDTDGSGFCVGSSGGSDFQTPDTSPPPGPSVGRRKEGLPRWGFPGSGTRPDRSDPGGARWSQHPSGRGLGHPNKKGKRVPGWEKSSPAHRPSVRTCVYLFCE